MVISPAQSVTWRMAMAPMAAVEPRTGFSANVRESEQSTSWRGKETGGKKGVGSKECSV